MLKPIFIVCCFLWALKLEATSLNDEFADSYSNSKLYSSSAIDTTDGSLKMKQLLSGYSKFDTSGKEKLFIVSPLYTIGYNTVQGAFLGTAIHYHRWNDKKQKTLYYADGSYGFSNKMVNFSAVYKRRYDNKKGAWYYLKLGNEILQINDYEPISSLINSWLTLTQELNFAKFYHKQYAEAKYSFEFFKAIAMQTSIEYANREAVSNTIAYSLFDIANRSFTSNNPINVNGLGQDLFSRHNALTLKLSAIYQVRQQYYTRVNNKLKQPRLTLHYKKGIEAFGAITNFDHLDLAIEGNIDFKLMGSFSYNFGAGGFLTNVNSTFIDYKHFRANQSLFTRMDIENFKMLEYYSYSTTQNYARLHLRYNFNSSLMKQFSLTRGMGFKGYAGINFLQVDKSNQFVEAYVGLSKLDFLRLEFVSSYGTLQHYLRGVRIGFDIFTESEF